NLTLAAPFLSEELLRNASRVLVGTEPLHVYRFPLVVFDINGVTAHAVSAFDNLAWIGGAITRSDLNAKIPPFGRQWRHWTRRLPHGQRSRLMDRSRAGKISNRRGRLAGAILAPIAITVGAGNAGCNNANRRRTVFGRFSLEDYFALLAGRSQSGDLAGLLSG